MSKNRIKVRAAEIRSREELETVVGNIAALKIEERTLKAEMDARLKEVREDYETRLADIADAIAARNPAVAVYAGAHPELFGTAKSVELLHGVIGWRVNTPSLKTLAGWTWDRVLDVVKNNKLLAAYLRVKEEVNKQSLLADRDLLGADGLRAIGVRVIQDEEFFIEPKITDTETRETVEVQS